MKNPPKGRAWESAREILLTKVRPLSRTLRNVIDFFHSPVPRELVILPHNGGFFSNFNKVMNHLVCSLDHYGIRAVKVDWHIDGRKKLPSFPYGRPQDGNIWKHFFEQLSFPSYSWGRQVKTSSYCYRDYSINSSNAYYLYTGGQEWRQRYHAAFAKHIRIRPQILQKVEGIYNRFMAGKYCIGVHIRNELHRHEQPGDAMPSLEDYVAQVKRILLSQKGEAVIFLASDVDYYIEHFKNVFIDKVVVQPNVARLAEQPDDPRIMRFYAEHTGVTFGEEVLVDCLLLARCDVLIHVVSNIATAAGYINPSLSMIYCG
jgi:hypothetical protein